MLTELGGGGGGGGLRGHSLLTNFLGSKLHLDWIKIDLNVTEIITVQDYKHLISMEIHISNVKTRVKQVIYESKI